MLWPWVPADLVPDPHFLINGCLAKWLCLREQDLRFSIRQERGHLLGSTPILQPGGLRTHGDKEHRESCRIKLSRMGQHDADHPSTSKRGIQKQKGSENADNPNYHPKIAYTTFHPAFLQGLAQENIQMSAFSSSYPPTTRKWGLPFPSVLHLYGEWLKASS